MKKRSMRIILARQKNITKIIRNPGFVLLEAVALKNLTADKMKEPVLPGQEQRDLAYEP
jgi:hypothetical protein